MTKKMTKRDKIVLKNTKKRYFYGRFPHKTATHSMKRWEGWEGSLWPCGQRSKRWTHQQLIVEFLNFSLSTLTSPRTTWTWSLPTRQWSWCSPASMTRRRWWECTTAPTRWPTAPGETPSWISVALRIETVTASHIHQCSVCAFLQKTENSKIAALLLYFVVSRWSLVKIPNVVLPYRTAAADHLRSVTTPSAATRPTPGWARCCWSMSSRGRSSQRSLDPTPRWSPHFSNT